MEKVIVGNKYRFKKDWSVNFDPIFYSAKKGDIVVFIEGSLCGHFKKVSDGSLILMSKKEMLELLEEV